MTDSSLVDDDTQVSTSERSTDEESHECCITCPVRRSNYYHGFISKNEAAELCRDTGDFLVRESEFHTGDFILVISVRADTGKMHHFVINTNDTKLLFVDTAHKHSTIPSLIKFYLSTGIPLSQSTNAILKRAIDRPPWMLNHDSIFLLQTLDKSAVGGALRAEYVSDNGRQLVALRILKIQHTRVERQLFLKEARMMRKLDHKNLVKILGLAVFECPLMLVMEWCDGGSMSDYLKKYGKTMLMKEKYRFVVETAEGLMYLETKYCTHRRIQAKSCLLSGENKTVKIGNFDLCFGNWIVRDEDLPLDERRMKWLAPETLLDRVYSTKSDLWAYAVLVWEVYSNGAEPYPGLTSVEIRATVIDTADRLTMPDDTPPALCEIARLCWQRIPEMRPSATVILSDLKTMVESDKKSKDSEE